MANSLATRGSTAGGRTEGLFGSIGSAFVTAALVFGPGSIATASGMGASFGYELLWVPVIATILMLCFVNIGVRIGLSTDRSILGTVAHRLSGVVAIIVGIGSFLVFTSILVGSSAGAGASSELLLGGYPDTFCIGVNI